MKIPTYKVTVNAQEFTRSSQRPYQFVVAVLRDEEYDRAQAYAALTPREVDGVTKNFRHMEAYAAGTWRCVFADGTEPRGGTQYDPRQQAVYQRVVDLGLPGYLEEVRAQRIEAFERTRASGAYRWAVYAWSQSEKNATKTANTWRNKLGYKAVRVLPVGSEVELPV
jgi:hypothetical protein